MTTQSNVDESVLQFDYEWRVGSRTVAAQIAKDYINTRRVELEPILSKYTREELVKLVDGARDRKRHLDRIILDMWLLTEYQPQDISGYGLVFLPDPRALIQLVKGDLV